MAAPTVHQLISATFATVAIADPISVSEDEGGSVVEFGGADSPNLKLVSVERIGATVTVTKAGYAAAPAIGDAGVLEYVMKARASGKGTTGAPVTRNWAVAICTGKSSGPTIEGTPTYSLTFRCHATP